MPEEKNKGICLATGVFTEIKKRPTFHEGLDLFGHPVHHEILGQAVHILPLVHFSHSLAKVQGLQRIRDEGTAKSQLIQALLSDKKKFSFFFR